MGNSIIANAAEDVQFAISFKLDVTYNTRDVVTGPLSFGLTTLPPEVNATFMINGIATSGTDGLEIEMDDVSSAEVSFGDAQWTELQNFSMVIGSSGNVTSLSYTFFPIDTVTSEGPIILNFPLTITGTDIASGNAFEYQYVNSTATISNLEPFLNVNIDIKPGSFPNSINLESNGATPVAILGSPNLDVNDVNPETLSLGSAGVKTVGKKNKTLCSIDDVSGDFTLSQEGDPDGYLDLICHFTTISIVPEVGNTTSTLKGEYFDGTLFEGTDSINIVP